MTHDDIAIRIAATSMRSIIDKSMPLVDRLKAAMRYVQDRSHDREIFYISGNVTDDLRFQTALVAVMLDAEPDERDLIVESLAPIKALAAMMAGVPVDVDAVMAECSTDRIIPLMRLYHESAE